MAQGSLLNVLNEFCKQHDLTLRQPDVTLTTVLLSTKGEFETIFSPPDGVAGFYNGIANTVVVYEKFENPDIPPRFERELAFTNLSHELVHQLLHNVGVQQRLSRWPSWMSEGLAEHLSAAAAMSHGGQGDAATLQHVHPIRLWQLQQIYPLKEDMVEAREALDGKRLRDVITASQLTADDYAIAWGFVRFLEQTHPEAFGRLLKEISQLGPLEGVTARKGQSIAANAEQFARHFDGNFAKWERAMADHLASLELAPRADNQIHFVVTIEYSFYSRITRTMSHSHSARVFATKVEANEWVLKNEQMIRKAETDDRQLRGGVRHLIHTYNSRSDAEAFTRNYYNAHEKR